MSQDCIFFIKLGDKSRNDERITQLYNELSEHTLEPPCLLSTAGGIVGLMKAEDTKNVVDPTDSKVPISREELAFRVIKKFLRELNSNYLDLGPDPESPTGRQIVLGEKNVANRPNYAKWARLAVDTALNSLDYVGNPDFKEDNNSYMFIKDLGMKGGGGGKH